MNFCSEGVVWELPFALPETMATAEERDRIVLQAVYGASYEPMPALNEEDRAGQWVH